MTSEPIMLDCPACPEKLALDPLTAVQVICPRCRRVWKVVPQDCPGGRLNLRLSGH